MDLGSNNLSMTSMQLQQIKLLGNHHGKLWVSNGQPCKIHKQVNARMSSTCQTTEAFTINRLFVTHINTNAKRIWCYSLDKFVVLL